MKYFVDLKSNVRVELTGNKFALLSNLSKITQVPDAKCLLNTAFVKSIPDTTVVENSLKLLESNGGYQLTRIQAEIERSLQNISIPKEVTEEIFVIAQQITANWKYPLIIRSSSAFEDTDEYSGAGIYKSIGNILKEADIIPAVKECWLASFSLEAVAHRLRAKVFTINPLPGLIFQRYITAEYSGVAFTQNPVSSIPGIFVEYAQGSTDGIESGENVTGSFLAVKGNSKDSYAINCNDFPRDIALKVAEVAENCKKHFNSEIDLEFAVQNKVVYGIQARPITTKSFIKRTSSAKPKLKIFDLYLDSEKFDKKQLYDVKEIYRHSSEKRKPIRMLAIENNITVYGAAMVIANARGVKNMVIKKIAALNRLKTPLLVIDLGPHIRAFFSKRENLKQMIVTLMKYVNDETALIIREFASGEFSAVTSPTENGAIVEVCRGSLIGLNRGFVNAQSYEVNLLTKTITNIPGGSLEGPYFDFDEKNVCFNLVDTQRRKNNESMKIADSALFEMAAFTIKASEMYGMNLLEWTIIDNKPVYIDNTPQSSKTETGKALTELGPIRYLSPGKIKGKALLVTDLKKLEYISSGPTLNVSGHLPTLEANVEISNLIKMVEKNPDIVLVSKYPYTALSVVVDKVRGFIFEAGPVLCHLAIISRECKTPIAIVPNALNNYKDGVEIDL